MANQVMPEDFHDNYADMETALDDVVGEFIEVFAPGVPHAVMMATVLRWTAEELHRTVQHFYGENFEKARPVEQYDNISRIAYMGCAIEFKGIPSIPRIMSQYR